MIMVEHLEYLDFNTDVRYKLRLGQYANTNVKLSLQNLKTYLSNSTYR